MARPRLTNPSSLATVGHLNSPFQNPGTAPSKEFLFWCFCVLEIVVVSMLVYAFAKGISLRSIARNITITSIVLLALLSLRLLLRAQMLLGLLGLGTSILGLYALSVP